eukprot:765942-Hanusia_phi.AAC.5
MTLTGRRSAGGEVGKQRLTTSSSIPRTSRCERGSCDWVMDSKRATEQPPPPELVEGRWGKTEAEPAGVWVLTGGAGGGPRSRSGRTSGDKSGNGRTGGTRAEAEAGASTGGAGGERVGATRFAPSLPPAPRLPSVPLAWPAGVFERSASPEWQVRCDGSNTASDIEEEEGEQ